MLLFLIESVIIEIAIEKKNERSRSAQSARGRNTLVLVHSSDTTAECKIQKTKRLASENYY